MSNVRLVDAGIVFTIGLSALIIPVRRGGAGPRWAMAAISLG